MAVSLHSKLNIYTYCNLITQKSLQPFCQQLFLSVQVFYNTIFIAVTVSQTNMDVSTRAHKHTHNQKKQ